MRSVLCIVLLFFLLDPGYNSTWAQTFIPAKVEISNEKANIGGNIFYVHKVIKGQTLYSISKAYSTSQDEIIKSNPTLSDGLKTGMLLYIPVSVSSSQTQVKEKTDTISQSQSKTWKQKQDSKKYRTHSVRWYESLNDIAVKYNVTVEAICSLNNIEDTGKRIKVRKLLIPDDDYIKYISSLEVSETESNIELPAEKEVETVPETTYIPARVDFPGSFEITLILPFNAGTDTNQISIYAADFYSGVLLAVKNLKNEGLFNDFTLKVIDLSGFPSIWSMLSSGTLENSSLIIGPILEKDLHPIATYAKEHRIPIISPLDMKTAGLVKDNPYFFLYPPDSESTLNRQIDKICMNDIDSKIIMIHEYGYENSDLVVQTSKEFEKKGVKYETFKYDMLKGRGIDAYLSLQMDSLKLNKIIIPSNNEAFVSDALRNLYLIQGSHNFQIEVYGMSKWMNSETMDAEYFHSLNLHLSVPYYIDYNNGTTTMFIKEYREVFNTEPSPYSYQGYDIMTYFTKALNLYGNSFPAKIINTRENLLQTDVLFIPEADGSGYRNNALKDIVYRKGWIISNDSPLY